MDLLDIIKSRRSIRKYKEDLTVTKEQLDMLLEAAMSAPSACNTRPWEFLVVSGREKLNEIANVHPYAKMLLTAPVAIIVCALPETQSGISMDYFPQDCAAATQNILVQAAAMGLGTCWCGVYPKVDRISEIRKIFSLQESVIPFNIIALGTADEKPNARGFYEQSKVHYVQ